MTTTSLDNFYSKFLDYKIYLPESKKMVNLAEQEALWFKTTGDHPDVVEYANAVKYSPNNPMSTAATLAFGEVGFDKATITTENGDIYGMVLSPEEYYFTDMVFMKQEYEQALVDLCCYKAILFPNSEEEAVADRITAIDKAIMGTKWVAEQNGVTIDDNKIKQKIREYVESETASYVQYFLHDETAYKNDNYTNKIKSDTEKVMEKLVQYYLDPSLETEMAFMDSIDNMEKDNHIRVFLSFMNIVAELSIGLFMALKRIHEDRLAGIEPHGKQLAPVEIGAREQKVNFK